MSHSPKFYFNNLMGGKDGREWWQSAIGLVLFGLACLGFAFTTYSTLDHLGPRDTDLYPAVEDRDMAEVLVWLSVAQVGYPLVAVLDYAWLRCAGLQYDEYDARLSALKDVLYATLDVTTKAGMALVAFLVATR